MKKQRVVYIAAATYAREAARFRKALDLVVAHQRMMPASDMMKGATTLAENLETLKRVDILWLLAPAETRTLNYGTESWFRLGAAVANAEVFVVSGDAPFDIDFRGLGQQVTTDEDAFAVICELLDEYPWIDSQPSRYYP